ncbi:AraC family transcriptional regulator [Paenibacillus rhizovicinus]|uniref:AraC family transcriptional regulator n=1 Tax=Paenibacillus rhizovicinus TaxID=2704463 RepID=A0A6C0P2K0_9BACL|nr:AraC family transcriptional regulator [Paenibacillus rhizovicinus]QHW32790.1 AraC family transcriptional regulator [Paenibacillus rhizovicinus]
MTIQRSIFMLAGKDLFDPALPIYVNRSVEDYNITEHRHDFLEIVYVSEGAGTHHLGEEAFPVAHGDIFFLPVGISHVFRPASTSPQHPLIVYNCVIAPDAALQLLRSIPGGTTLQPLLESPRYRMYRDPYGEFHRLFQRLHYEYLSDQPGRETALYQGVLGLLLHLFRLDGKSEAAGANAIVPNGLETVISAVHSRFEQELPAKGMAAIAGIGERQFHRLFLKQTGMSFKAYHQNVRINEACRLLRTTDRKISDIASAVGYQDMPYFNGLFRRKNGVSPREYRKQASS